MEVDGEAEVAISESRICDEDEEEDSDDARVEGEDSEVVEDDDDEGKEEVEVGLGLEVGIREDGRRATWTKAIVPEMREIG